MGFGTLQGALKSRGKIIIEEHEKRQDALCVWHKFLQPYRFDANLSLHESKQKEILAQIPSKLSWRCHSILEECEEAFTNIDSVSQHTNELDCTQLFTDSGQRESHTTNFSLKHCTVELITSIEVRINAWCGHQWTMHHSCE